MSGRWKMKNQFIDLEAQVGSDDEDLSDAEDGGRVASFIDDTLQDKPRTSSTLAPGLSTTSESPVDFSASTRPNRLGTLVGRIEDKYLNHPKEPVADDLQVDELERRGWLWLRGQDWALWRVKCTPSQEYFILYELMLKHETLSDELRAVFFNPRDVSYIYLEARFSKVGISSLREVLRGFSDIRMSTLVVVPEMDLQRCLTIPDLDNQVFARGQWIQIKRGLYRGDVGLVVDDYHDDDSTTGVKVLVVPRLEFSDEDGPPTSSSSKRKRLPSRPSPQLFNPSRCIQDQLFCREKHVYSYKSWRFEYGLQLKTYNKLTLSPAREIPAALCHLFMESKEMAANENALIEMSSMPVPSFWRFETGDHIIVYSPTGAKFGTIVSLPENYNTLLPQCEVDVEEEGSQLVSVRDLQKNIILGEFIEVLAGVHAGKKGFVVAKTDALLGICAGSRTNGLVS
ncbi:hypothetical protein F5890DRAFT_1559904 [Lentinula detonsa]|uniref:NGN domain-containing protein n=1 Tax=Lentinula detonsa TaxID=2804962 RepID=A0AA38PN71_9AGAR|nr:hypothetical protein F5890DRAFT_1559904 [Lentinula detonsa]